MKESLSTASPTSLLHPRELEAYKKYLDDRKPPLSPSTVANLFSLYLQGQSCEEIAALNPGFGIGAIVRARVDHEWDKLRDEHITHLMENARLTAHAAQLDAIRFIAEGLAAYRKLAGDKFKRFLQTGDEKDLGGFKDMSFKMYKELLELLFKLTGQDTPTQKVVGNVVHTHTVDPSPQPAPHRPMSSNDAASFLSRIGNKEEK